MSNFDISQDEYDAALAASPSPAPLEKLVSIVEDGAFGWGVLLNGTPVKCLFSTRVDAEEWLRATLTAPLGEVTNEMYQAASDAYDAWEEPHPKALRDALQAAIASLHQQAGNADAPGLIKAAEWHEERAAGLADDREEANKRSKFHHYMASKEELLHATCAKHFRSLRRVLNQPTPDDKGDTR